MADIYIYIKYDIYAYTLASMVFQLLCVYRVVVVLTLTHNTMQAVVAAQAPTTLEWKKHLAR